MEDAGGQLELSEISSPPKKLDKMISDLPSAVEKKIERLPCTL